MLRLEQEIVPAHAGGQCQAALQWQLAVSTVKVCQQGCSYTGLARPDHPTPVSCTAAALLKLLHTNKNLGLRLLSRTSDGAADGPDADLAISVATVQGLAVCGPGQGDAEGDLRLLAQVGEVGLQLVHDALALQVPDLHTRCPALASMGGYTIPSYGCQMSFLCQGTASTNSKAAVRLKLQPAQAARLARAPLN